MAMRSGTELTVDWTGAVRSAQRQVDRRSEHRRRRRRHPFIIVASVCVCACDGRACADECWLVAGVWRAAFVRAQLEKRFVRDVDVDAPRVRERR